GYRSVLRTFISAFIASYEVNLQVQPEDNNSTLILDIICKIYRGEDSARILSGISVYSVLGQGKSY
ncbi:nucleoporin Nup188-like protein, partial [Trifolium medium]|nr:nucleoporin Nup188-like protein [Trifolium medium]